MNDNKQYFVYGSFFLSLTALICAFYNESPWISAFSALAALVLAILAIIYPEKLALSIIALLIAFLSIGFVSFKISSKLLSRFFNIEQHEMNAENDTLLDEDSYMDTLNDISEEEMSNVDAEVLSDDALIISLSEKVDKYVVELKKAKNGDMDAWSECAVISTEYLQLIEQINERYSQLSLIQQNKVDKLRKKYNELQ